MINAIIRFCLENKLVVILTVIAVMFWGILVAPFDWQFKHFIRNPVAVDAIPDIGENQQIVFTRWMGRSPQDVEDQITYPLTTALLGIPGVKTIRSYSFFGFSSIYIVFKEDIEFYWSRSRILEKLSSLPAGLLPENVEPSLGPDATALGQVFWYTLEGFDPKDQPAGGWDLHELRSIQDWYVRYALQSVEGVAEVASIGGYVQEYQIDIDPDAMRVYGIQIEQVFQAVKESNLDVGARTIEINKIEYVIRARGFLNSLDDIKKTVLKVHDNIPITLDQIAHISMGPALRRGALDKGGSEAVGGVVVVRFGANPLEVIQRIKLKIQEISQGLPSKTISNGIESKVRIVPFYDRSTLIYETLGTLNTALIEEILITIIVVLVMVLHFKSSLLISSLLPISVLMCFIAMKYFKVDANIVALSGIAIAIGTMVDMGIILCENILNQLEKSKKEDSTLEVIYQASAEVGGAILTAVLTTIVSFLPVFTMEAAEGKLFKPLAFTKTFALLASIIVALTIIPTLAHLLFTRRPASYFRNGLKLLLCLVAVFLGFNHSVLAGIGLLLFSTITWGWNYLPPHLTFKANILFNIAIAFGVTFFLANHWQPIGPENRFLNSLFCFILIFGLLGSFLLFKMYYTRILSWCLRHKLLFLSLPAMIAILGLNIWLGSARTFFFMPEGIKRSAPFLKLTQTFPGLGKEFMPPLDEGSYLFMPTTMPHASIGEAMNVLSTQDKYIGSIPEIDQVVGKIGRADSPLDPAPISMIETVISYKPEYITDKHGNRINFKYDDQTKTFPRDAQGNLIPDSRGRPFRQWREHIKKPDDIWHEITTAAALPGTTGAPKLQPIAARVVMLQSGMRAPMGVKIFGPDQKTIEKVGLSIEKFLKEVPLVEHNTVIADRIVGKPYLEIDLNREAIARYGISIGQVQKVIEVAVGGMNITNTVEGRERYPVRVRYMRELRDSIESLENILVTGTRNTPIPLKQLATIRYTPGPQMIKSENTFLTGYVVFDKKSGASEVDVVRQCEAYLQQKLQSGELVIPKGTTYTFSGTYENQIRSEKKLMVVLPLALFVIFMILYLQFKSISVTMIIFSGVFIAWSGGFMMLWLYGQDWFLNIQLFDLNLRDLFQIRPFNLSVAVWVGFLALFGIATDDGVVMTTYLDQTFQGKTPKTRPEIHALVIEAASRRIRPCLMTSATTILALIPVLTSTGRGSDVMVPMAIPSFGGMTIVLITVFVVPVLYAFIQELKMKTPDHLKS